jgi:hypothetical protein
MSTERTSMSGMSASGASISEVLSQSNYDEDVDIDTIFDDVDWTTVNITDLERKWRDELSKMETV